MGVVYRLINTVNSKSYVGFARDQERIEKFHTSYPSGAEYVMLNEAIRKYGWSAFTIVIENPSTTNIKLSKDVVRGEYNISSLGVIIPFKRGATRDTSFYSSPEYKEKQAAKRRGKVWSEEIKRKIGRGVSRSARLRRSNG